MLNATSPPLAGLDLLLDLIEDELLTLGGAEDTVVLVLVIIASRLGVTDTAETFVARVVALDPLALTEAVALALVVCDGTTKLSGTMLVDELRNGLKLFSLQQKQHQQRQKI